MLFYYIDISVPKSALLPKHRWTNGKRPFARKGTSRNRRLWYWIPSVRWWANEKQWLHEKPTSCFSLPAVLFENDLSPEKTLPGTDASGIEFRVSDGEPMKQTKRLGAKLNNQSETWKPSWKWNSKTCSSQSISYQISLWKIETVKRFNPSKSEKRKRLTWRIIWRRPKFLCSSFKIIPQWVKLIHTSSQIAFSLTHFEMRFTKKKL